MPNGSKRVLVVDDETADRERISNLLRRENYKVFATGTCSGAINTQARHAGEIELLITDISLPEKNGCELYEELLKVEPELKVLFVSGPTGAEAFRFRRTPVSELNFLGKPFDEETLLARVRMILESAAPAQANGA